MNTTKTILLCAAVAAGAATAADTNETAAAKAPRPSSVTEADLAASPLARLAKAIEDGDAATVAKHVRYPLGRKTPLPPVENEATFIELFPVLFDEAFLERMRDGSFTNDWVEVGWRGTMFNNGDLWVDGTIQDGGLICGVNYQSAAERTLWEAAIDAERRTLHASLADLCAPGGCFVTQDGAMAGRIDLFGDNPRHARIALFDMPVRPGDEPKTVFRAADYPGGGSGGAIWLDEYWRFIVFRAGIVGSDDPAYCLYEKDDPFSDGFSRVRPADPVSWSDLMNNAPPRPTEPLKDEPNHTTTDELLKSLGL